MIDYNGDLSNIVLEICNKYLYEYDSKENRNKLILELNSKIFNALFKEYKPKIIYLSKLVFFVGVMFKFFNNLFSIMIDYNEDLYNILSFEKIYKILIRKEKLKKLRNL